MSKIQGSSTAPRPEAATRERARAKAAPVRSAPELDVHQEVRFAVVMYGGVSLAIYINGVAQEILRLVQATAPLDKDGDHARPLEAEPGRPPDTTWTYRKLAYLLSDEALRVDYRKQLEAGEPAPEQDLAEQAVRDGKPLRTRFVVDILSGTSAGGINGVFLAKALANNRDMNEIKKLWVEEGDMAVLLNDSRSLAGLGLPLQSPPQSLLNSQRMYAKLLEALERMEEPRRSTGEPASPFVEELDLFVTATDLEGVPLPIRLSDKLVYERRHRNVFHFKYSTATATGEDRNDFEADNNPFIAFAARCTSAFPFAFEPMCLCDIDHVLDTFPGYRDRDECRSSSARWQPFFREPLDPRTGAPRVDFARRAFADGGYLDNKPFSYATETMQRRHADLMVDRKLIYIEPAPAHPELALRAAERPDALSNVKAATLDLPSYETIREDLQRVLQRNRLIQGVNRLIADVERDIEMYERSAHERSARPEMAEHAWNGMDLAEMIERYGIYYLPYRRLRIAAVTDEFAELLARLGGFDRKSDYFIAIRSLVRVWRERVYKEYREKPDERTVNQYLSDFDLSYRLRRMAFARQRIGELQRLLMACGRRDPAAAQEARAKLAARLGLEAAIATDELPALEKLLAGLKREINALYMELRHGGRHARRRMQGGMDEEATDEQQIARAVRGLRIGPQHLEYVLGVAWDPARARVDDRSLTISRPDGDDSAYHERARTLLAEPQRFGLDADLAARLDQVAEMLRERLASFMWPTKERARELLDEGKPFATLAPPCDAALRELDASAPGFRLVAPVRAYLWHYFDHFEHFDQIRFPVLYETGVSESDVVEVIRISPEDATSLIDEQAESRKDPSQKPRGKLAGTSLHHFGAFLDRAWRQNDIMWGRLDGAERLISALLPEPEDAPIRKALLDEAHTAILAEELPGEERTELDRIMAGIRARVAAGERFEQVLEEVLRDRRTRPTIAVAPETASQATLERRELLGYVRSEYAVNRDLDPEAMLRLMSRSTQVVGKMFESLADQYRLGRSGVAWVARLGQVLWGLIEVATPQSILHLMFRHWMKLLYVFEGFIIVGSWLLGESGWNQFGWRALGITGVVHVVVLLMRDFMQRRTGRWMRLAPALLIGSVLVLAGFGLDRLAGLGFYEWAAEYVAQPISQALDRLPWERGGDSPER
jgi:patatin-related protein